VLASRFFARHSGRPMASRSRKPGLAPHGSSRRMVVAVVPPVDELDLVGPLQVFNSVNRLAGKPIYVVEVVTSADSLTVEGESGVLAFVARRHFSQMEGTIDSVLLVCGMAARSVRDPALSAWLQKISGEVCRVGAVCVGAFLLAEAGLLDDRRATAHWKFGRELAARYPSVRVEHDRLWVKDGHIYTSAGVSAGIDLALAWVEDDCGAALAHEAARELVLFLRRPGGQPQVSVSLASQAAEMASIRDLQIWIADHVNARLTVTALAHRMSMSVRTFERVFHQGSRNNAFAVCLADSRRGRPPSSRTNHWRTEGGGVRHRIRHGRCDATGFHSFAGNHPPTVSPARDGVGGRHHSRRFQCRLQSAD